MWALFQECLTPRQQSYAIAVAILPSQGRLALLPAHVLAVEEEYLSGSGRHALYTQVVSPTNGESLAVLLSPGPRIMGAHPSMASPSE